MALAIGSPPDALPYARRFPSPSCSPASTKPTEAELGQFAIMSYAAYAIYAIHARMAPAGPACAADVLYTLHVREEQNDVMPLKASYKLI